MAWKRLKLSLSGHFVRSIELSLPKPFWKYGSFLSGVFYGAKYSGLRARGAVLYPPQMIVYFSGHQSNVFFHIVSDRKHKSQKAENKNKNRKGLSRTVILAIIVLAKAK